VDVADHGDLHAPPTERRHDFRDVLSGAGLPQIGLRSATSEHGSSHLGRVARFPEGGRCDAARTRRREDVVDPPGAALLIRVWLEDAGEFRARLLTPADVAAGGRAEEITVAVASSPGEVLAAVRAWLDGSTRQSTDPVDTDA
jgi:hypothetical protein